MTFETTTLEDDDYHEENDEASGESDVHKYFLNLEKMKKKKQRELKTDLEDLESSGGSEDLVKKEIIPEPKIELTEPKKTDINVNNKDVLLKSKENETQKESKRLEYSEEIIEEEMINEPKIRISKQSKSQAIEKDVECDSNEDCHDLKKETKRTDTNVKKRQEEYLAIDHESNHSTSDKHIVLENIDSLLLDELWKLRWVLPSFT